MAYAATADDYPVIRDLLLSLAYSDDRIVPTYALILKEGFKHNLVFKAKYNVSDIGVHRKNRDEVMINGSEAMDILDQIDRVGVNPDAYKDATAFEEGPKRENETALMKKIMSDHLIPKKVPGRIRVSTVACSHFIQSLEAINQEMVPPYYTWTRHAVLPFLIFGAHL